MRILLKVCLAAVAVAAVSGCGHIGKSMASNEKLLDKAEFATGIERSQLEVVEGSVNGTMDSVEFRVKSKNGKLFRCYYTTALWIQSDALCTAIDSTGKAYEDQKSKARESGNCNALLRAAGRC